MYLPISIAAMGEVVTLMFEKQVFENRVDSNRIIRHEVMVREAKWEIIAGGRGTKWRAIHKILRALERSSCNDWDFDLHFRHLELV